MTPLRQIFVSPSQLETFDLCKRKWAFQQIKNRRRTEDTTAQTFGITGHTHAQNWLKQGTLPPDTPEGAAMRQGIEHLPAPSPEILTEHEFALGLFNEIVLAGQIDVMVPPHLHNGRPLVIDHKFTKDIRYAKTHADLANDNQAVIYGVVAMETYKVKEVEARWLYYVASGKAVRKPKGARPVSRVLTFDGMQEPWNRIVQTCDELATLKRNVTKAHDVEPTVTACTAFGGCEFADICERPKGSVLAAHFKQFEKMHGVKNGSGHSLSLGDRIQSQQQNAQPTETTTMGSLSDKLNKSWRKN